MKRRALPDLGLAHQLDIDAAAAAARSGGDITAVMLTIAIDSHWSCSDEVVKGGEQQIDIEGSKRSLLSQHSREILQRVVFTF